MTASSWASTASGLPAAFIGEAYEVALGVTAPTNVTTLSSAAGNDTGLPPGLVLNADGQRITGTPTGAASTPAGSGVAQSGPGAYTFTLKPNSTDTGVTRQFTINLYSSRNDQAYLSSLTLAQQVKHLAMS